MFGVWTVFWRVVLALGLLGVVGAALSLGFGAVRRWWHGDVQ